jgi:dihydroflavonol-4-reductase
MGSVLGELTDSPRFQSGLVIVTGGAGFIGSHLVERLVEAGNSVRVLERPGARVDHLPAGVDVAFADIRDRLATRRALDGGRWVYHLAANPNLWARDPNEFAAVNYHGTIHVLEGALEAGAERVLHTSTESILTRADMSAGTIDEQVEVTLTDTVGPYCKSKLQAEQYAFSLAARGLPVLVANPTMPVGPGDRGLSPPTRLIRDFCRGALPATMDCTLNLIDVRDVAHGLHQVFARGVPGRRYLLGHTNLTLVGLLTMLSELTGVPVPRWRVPYPIGFAVAWISELQARYVTGQSPRASVTGIRLARRIMHFDPSRTHNELVLRPRPIVESLTDCVRWLQEMGHLDAATSRKRYIH